MYDFSLIPPEIMEFIRITAIGGFITTSTLVISLNFRAFNKVFSYNAKKLWWLFMLLMIIPLLITLYVFTLIFGDYNIIQAIAGKIFSKG